MFDISPTPTAPMIPLQQSAVFHAALTRLGVPARQHRLPGGLAQVIERRLPALGSVGLISRGPVWDMRPNAKALAALRRALGLRHLIINAETTAEAAALRAAGFLRIAAPVQIAELDLSGDRSAWLAAMTGKWRNRLRHGQGQGLILNHRPMPADPDHWLFQVEADQQKALGYRSLPKDLLLAMADQTPQALHLFTASLGQTPIAAMLFVSHGATASYQIGWSNARGRRRSAHPVILWAALQFLAATGHRALDLGLYDAARSPGLARFKRGSGAGVRSLGGTWLDSGVLAPLHAWRRQV